MSQELYDRERELMARLAREIRSRAAMTTYDHRPFLGSLWTAAKPIHLDPVELSQGRLIFALGSVLQPRRILEVGIGPGITAHSLISASEEPRTLAYHGIDKLGSPFHRDAVQETFVNIAARCPATMQASDSDDLEAFVHPAGRIDLLHVDGDHSFDHQRRDVEKAIRSGAEWLLVDDCNDTEVVTAVFAAWRNEWNHAWRGGLLPMIYFEHSRTGSMLFHLGMWK